jgi:hypothetical protein
MNQCAEINLRAERRAGEMLKAIPREPGERTDLTSGHDVTRLTNYEEVLKDNNLEARTSYPRQFEAEIPEYMRLLHKGDEYEST